MAHMIHGGIRDREAAAKVLENEHFDVVEN
jgi:hypothetical protein